MNDIKFPPYFFKTDQIERFKSLTIPELMSLQPEEKSQLLPVADEIVFSITMANESDPVTFLDLKEKALFLLNTSDVSDESLTKHVRCLSSSILPFPHFPFGSRKIDTIRSGGLKGSLGKMVYDLSVRKKELPYKPSKGTMAFFYISAFLMAAVFLLLLFHPGISAWFKAEGYSVLLAVLAIIVTVGTLVASGSFFGGFIGFIVFAVATWMLNKLIPMQFFVKGLTLTLLGLGALLMFGLGQGESDNFRQGKDQEYADQASAIYKDIKSLRLYVCGLKGKASRAMDYADAHYSDDSRRLGMDSCEVVMLYYTHAEECLDELLKDLF